MLISECSVSYRQKVAEARVRALEADLKRTEKARDGWKRRYNVSYWCSNTFKLKC